MSPRGTVQMITAAIRVNLLPGLLLQCLIGIFLFAYATHDGTRQFLAALANLKQQAGFSFAFFSYVFAAALLPEMLRIAFFQSGKPTLRNLRLLLTAAPAWGLMGVAVDIFYRCQSIWFGDGNSLSSIVPKVLVDQFLFSPFFCNPVTIGYFAFRDAGFSSGTWKQILRFDYYWEHVAPVQVAGWIIWIPSVCLIYSMPPLLQIPIAVVIMCFWVLLFTTLGERISEK